MQYETGDRVTLKKPHPCGGYVWEIVRTGVDIKLRCQTCGKYQNLTRDKLAGSTKSVTKKDEEQGS